MTKFIVFLQLNQVAAFKNLSSTFVFDADDSILSGWCKERQAFTVGYHCGCTGQIPHSSAVHKSCSLILSRNGDGCAVTRAFSECQSATASEVGTKC